MSMCFQLFVVKTRGIKLYGFKNMTADHKYCPVELYDQFFCYTNYVYYVYRLFYNKHLLKH